MRSDGVEWPFTWIGVVTRESLSLVPALAPGVVIGLPFGFYVIRKIEQVS
jgi:hypothetical protein